MSLQTRLAALISAIGPDIKSLQAQIDMNYKAMLPTDADKCNMPFSLIVNNVSSLTSGRLTLVRCPVKKGEQINGISFFSVGAANTPTHQVFSLWDQNRNQLAITGNDTTTAWGANTRKRLALSTPYTPTADTWLYVGIAVTASVVPTLGGVGTASQITGLAPIMHGISSSTSITTPASHPATAGALTALAGCPAVLLD